MDIGGYPVSGYDPSLTWAYYYKTGGDGKIFEQFGETTVYQDENGYRDVEAMWTYYFHSSVLGVPVAQLDVKRTQGFQYSTLLGTTWSGEKKSFVQMGGRSVATVSGDGRTRFHPLA